MLAAVAPSTAGAAGRAQSHSSTCMSPLCRLHPLPQMPTFATQRQVDNHKAEPLLFEVQLLRVGGVK